MWWESLLRRERLYQASSNLSVNVKEKIFELLVSLAFSLSARIMTVKIKLDKQRAWKKKPTHARSLAVK